MALLYDASDYGFAVRAVAALRAAGIPCYTEGEGRFTGEPIDHRTGRPARDENARDVETSPEPDPKDFDLSSAEEKELKDAEDRSPLVSRQPVHCCIYVDNDEDYQRASELLLKLGAAREPMISAKEVEWINRWTTTIALIGGVGGDVHLGELEALTRSHSAIDH